MVRPYSSSSYASRRAKPKPVAVVTAAAAPPPPRPKEIPYQGKVANSVNLIGKVSADVDFRTSPVSLKPYAATVLTRHSSDLWIPLIFQGDLAHTAHSHLKLDDVIHIAGHLTTDPPIPTKSLSNASIQVMVESLNFVHGHPLPSKLKQQQHQEDDSALSTQQQPTPSSYDSEKLGTDSKQKEDHGMNKAWLDLLLNPAEWWDVRSTKDNPKVSAFERKTNGELLFINSSIPKWLLEKLESITIDLKPELKPAISAATKKDPASSSASWDDLLADPKQWSDFRDSKRNGLVNPRFPDFKRKDGSASLWLSRFTKWVLPKLEGLEFAVPVVQSKAAKGAKGLEFAVPVVQSKAAKGAKGDQSWNDLLENPDKWWDNRSNKKNVKAPDFKHKETGEVLWLNRSPSWVLPKLPPVKPKESV
ncbi:hypothetical protein RIF29_04812 [Crotalaria pallida]|uniref:Uncharacterized protein n=1 Tax=Crotalaria pallida TaxID=3830 RepID=A0AAN9J3W8_CROPI